MRVLVFQHMAVEHPGVFRDLWRTRGYRVTIVELDTGGAIPNLEDFDLLAAMGGGMEVWDEDEYPWLKVEKAAIRHWVQDLGKPYIGVCLGHQLLAAALGGDVRMMAKAEIGVTKIDLTAIGASDPLFSSFAASFTVLEWHGAEVTTPPIGAHVLATNSVCHVQAMRWGRCAYGFQFHPEITASTLSDWLGVSANDAGLENALGPGAASRLSEALSPLYDRFRDAAERIVLKLEDIITPNTNKQAVAED